MRFAVFALVASIASIASIPTVATAAPPKPPIVWQNRVIPRAPGPAALTTVSHTLYLNDCTDSRCTVTPGSDNSLTNRSSIPINQVSLNAYPHGIAHWEQLVACVRETFRPFDIQVVTTDPGPSTRHFEVMIGGSSQQLRIGLDAGGVAPFIACGATQDNTISFVFPETTADLEFLCGAVAQEACHVWGLDHALNRDDPMTYLDLGSPKRFQNDDASCGEVANQPRACFCGGSTQNSFRYMTQTFGLARDLGPIAFQLTKPTAGQWLRPEFGIQGMLTSELPTLGATLAIDGVEVATAKGKIIAFNAPANVPTGDRKLSVTASDFGDRTATAEIDVHVIASCSATAKCPSKLSCLGGLCYPGKDVAGGLGARCESNEDCLTGACGNDGTDKLCTGMCEAGGGCPSGFDCRRNVCWPSDGGGCTTTGGAPGWALFGLGALAFALRRRR